MNNTSLLPSISNSTPTPEAIPNQDHFKNAVTFLHIYATPVIVLVGLIANSLATCVFLCTSLRHQSSSIYLAALALVDTGFLLTVFTNWFSWITESSFSNVVWCQLVIYFAYVFGFLSVWYLVAFTVERYIAVCHPFIRYTMCSTRRAKIVVCSLTAGAAVAYNFALWSSRVVIYNGKPFCIPKENLVQAVTIAAGVDGALTMIVPSLVVVLLNLRIGIQIYRSRHHTGKHVHSSANSSGCVSSSCSNSTTITETNQSIRKSSVVTKAKKASTSSDRGAPTRKSSAVAKEKKASTSSDKRPPSKTQRQVSNKSNESNSIRSQKQTTSTQSHLKTNRLLFIVSTFFLVLNGPSHVIRSYYMYRQMAAPPGSFWPSRVGIQLQELFQIFYYINFSVNFFLYSFGAKRFRTAMHQWWCQLWERVKRVCRCRQRANGVGFSRVAQGEPEVRTDQGESLTLVVYSRK